MITYYGPDYRIEVGGPPLPERPPRADDGTAFFRALIALAILSLCALLLPALLYEVAHVMGLVSDAQALGFPDASFASNSITRP